MRRKVFLSYRRGDAWAPAGWLFSRLQQILPSDQLFMDIHSIEIGDDFRHALMDELDKARVLVAIIGKDWSGSRADTPLARIMDPNDYVRMEVAYAIRNGLVIFPILVDNAEVFSIDLPQDIADLKRRQHFRLRREAFSSDIDRLIPMLVNATSSRNPPEPLQVNSTAPDIGRVFQDFERGPELVVVPPGHFVLGSSGEELGHEQDEGPQKLVIIRRPFAVGRFTVTFDEWDYYMAKQATGLRAPDNGRGRSKRPVVNVSWQDAHAYLSWLTAKTGACYRFPSEAEWEYAARAGSLEQYWWGDSADSARANYTYAGSHPGTVDVDKFSPNPWGLFNSHGNVWEWVADNWSENHANNLGNGQPVLVSDSHLRVVRGGSWKDGPHRIRSAARNYERHIRQSDIVGFRVARDIQQ